MGAWDPTLTLHSEALRPLPATCPWRLGKSLGLSRCGRRARAAVARLPDRRPRLPGQTCVTSIPTLSATHSGSHRERTQTLITQNQKLRGRGGGGAPRGPRPLHAHTHTQRELTGEQTPGHHPPPAPGSGPVTRLAHGPTGISPQASALSTVPERGWHVVPGTPTQPWGTRHQPPQSEQMKRSDPFQ